MKLKTLLKDLPNLTIKGSRDIEISGLSAHSKAVGPGNLFIAKKGFNVNGMDYISEAIGAGAQAILSDFYDPFIDKKITQIIHPSVMDIEAILASRYYQNPSEKLYLIGVTGTNGKTTTTFLIKYLLEEHSSCGLIGSIEYRVGKNVLPSFQTTPDVITCHKLLRDMVISGCTDCVMEVTSHGIDQKRIGQMDFKVGVFTNLTQDHLDYHKTMEEYGAVKERFFSSLSAESTAIFNEDDLWASKMSLQCQAKKMTYGLNPSADVFASRINLSVKGTQFELHYQGKVKLIRTHLIGLFNVYNTLASIATALTKGMSLDLIGEKIIHFKGVAGRLERIDPSFNFFVDYAHTPDALLNVLKTLKECSKNVKAKLILVFGCGGSRDQDKRSKMGEIAADYADLSIITNDNPRQEDPLLICKDILSGFKKHESYVVELDRYQAIKKALTLARPQDMVLIAGKGHETSQVFARHTLPFNDKEAVKEILKSL